MLVHFASRLVRHILRREAFDQYVVYEGPELNGEGVFHSLTCEQKVVALYLALKHLGDQEMNHPMTEWKNSALECIYAWAIYEISQEIKTSDVSGRNILVKAHQYLVDVNSRQSSTGDNLVWSQIIDRLATQLIYSFSSWKIQFGKEKVQELIVNKELFDMAVSYFEEVLANPTHFSFPQ